MYIHGRGESMCIRVANAVTRRVAIMEYLQKICDKGETQMLEKPSKNSNFVVPKNQAFPVDFR